MKTLTVWQPWASLIAIGAKPYEFRSWKPPAGVVGQRIAIHAGARPVKQAEVRDLLSRLADTQKPPCLHADEALPLLRALRDGFDHRPMFDEGEPFTVPLSHVLCTAVVGPGKRGDECAAEFGFAAGNDSDREGTFNWGWPMLGIEAVVPPVPARGAQGLWEWKP